MSNKPFACKHDGCNETFANEDHCLVHQKRHEMVLNVGLANKNQAFADQTPTPTRFIRNCEEVGLFQDLQNVNPFDETFKKAIDYSKNTSETLFSGNDSFNISDDTLHTPHIFPHIEAHSSKSSTSNDISDIINSACTDSDSPLDRSDALIIIDDSEEEVDQIIVDINQTNLRSLPETEEASSCIEIPTSEKNNQFCIKIEPNTNIAKTRTLRDKLRERLQTRNISDGSKSGNPTKDQDNDKYLPHPVCRPQNFNNNILTDTYNLSLVVQKSRKRRCVSQKEKSATSESVVSSSTEINSVDSTEPDEETVNVCTKDEDRKMRNRVAQSRSRLRKKIHHDVLNNKLTTLQTHTDQLRSENKALKKQVHELKKYILTHHQKCAFTGDMSFLKKCLAEGAEKDKSAATLTTLKKRKLVPVLPKNTPTLQSLPFQSSGPILLKVPPMKIPPNGSLKYIVITPPSN